MTQNHREPNNQNNEKIKDRGLGGSKIMRNKRSKNIGENDQKVRVLKNSKLEKKAKNEDREEKKKRKSRGYYWKKTEQKENAKIERVK